MLCVNRTVHVLGYRTRATTGIEEPILVTLDQPSSLSTTFDTIATSHLAYPIYQTHFSTYAYSSNRILAYRNGVIVANVNGFELARDTITPTLPARGHWNVSRAVYAVDGRRGLMAVATGSGLFSARYTGWESLALIDSLPVMAQTVRFVDDSTILAVGDSATIIRMDEEGRLRYMRSIDIPFRRNVDRMLRIDSGLYAVGAVMEGCRLLSVRSDSLALLKSFELELLDIVRLAPERLLLGAYRYQSCVVDLTDDPANPSVTWETIMSSGSFRSYASIDDHIAGFSQGIRVGRISYVDYDTARKAFIPLGVSGFLRGEFERSMSFLEHVWIGGTSNMYLHALSGGVIDSTVYRILPGPLAGEPYVIGNDDVWVPCGYNGLLRLTPNDSEVERRFEGTSKRTLWLE